MLYCDWHVATTYLLPVYRYFKKHCLDAFEVFFAGTAESCFSYLDGVPIEDCRPRMAPFDFVLCCDSLSVAPAQDDRRIVLFHGLASKSQDFCSRRRGKCDFGHYVAPSAYYQERLTRMQGISPHRFIGTGLSKFDVLPVGFRRAPKPVEPLIAYMPTHNPALNSISVLGEQIYSLQNLAVHLHGYTAFANTPAHRGQKDLLGERAGKSSQALNNVELLEACDVLVADYGSTVLEGLALGKYVVQVQNKEAIPFLEARVSGGDSVADYPEVALPKKYAFLAKSISDIEGFLSNLENYPRKEVPENLIVENVGGFGVSRQIEKFLRGRL